MRPDKNGCRCYDETALPCPVHADRIKTWVPYGPGGSPINHLADMSESSAWRNLMKECADKGMHHNTRSALELRGYTVKRKALLV